MAICICLCLITLTGPADTNLLYKAVVCYTQVLSAEKLKLQGGTWRLLATLVLSDNAHIKAVTLQLLRSLLSASHLNKTGSKAGGKGGARKSRVPGTVPAGNAAIVQGVAGQYKAGIMLLYSNCDEKCRKQLIEEVSPHQDHHVHSNVSGAGHVGMYHVAFQRGRPL